MEVGASLTEGDDSLSRDEFAVMYREIGCGLLGHSEGCDESFIEWVRDQLD